MVFISKRHRQNISLILVFIYLVKSYSCYIIYIDSTTEKQPNQLFSAVILPRFYPHTKKTNIPESSTTPQALVKKRQIVNIKIK